MSSGKKKAEARLTICAWFRLHNNQVYLFLATVLCLLFAPHARRLAIVQGIKLCVVCFHSFLSGWIF